MNNFLTKESAEGFREVSVESMLLTKRKIFLTEEVNETSCHGTSRNGWNPTATRSILWISSALKAPRRTTRWITSASTKKRESTASRI